MAALVGAAAVQSLIVGRERPHSAEARDLSALGRQMAAEEVGEQPLAEAEGEDSGRSNDTVAGEPIIIEGEQ
jgi:hypothetical protein